MLRGTEDYVAAKEAHEANKQALLKQAKELMAAQEAVQKQAEGRSSAVSGRWTAGCGAAQGVRHWVALRPSDGRGWLLKAITHLERVAGSGVDTATEIDSAMGAISTGLEVSEAGPVRDALLDLQGKLSGKP